MVATSDFSGLVSSACALASAPAMVPIESLDWCTGCLHVQDFEAHGSGFRPFGPDAMPDGFLGVFRHQALQFGLGALVLEKSRPGPAKHAGKLAPGIGRAHVDAAHGFDPRPWRLNAEQSRFVAALNAAPELLLSCEQEVLIDRISRNGDLDPFAAPGDNR